MAKNIVLIGLPGCGKTTVGKRIAKNMRCRFCDTDQMVEQIEKRTISEIFAEDGESYFREVESECVKQAAILEGAVIATGGGVVLNPQNMAALKKNGVVYFLDRPVNDIAARLKTERRPLLKNNKSHLLQLQKERDRLYRKYASAVCSGGTAAELAETIQMLYEMTECEP